LNGKAQGAIPTITPAGTQPASNADLRRLAAAFDANAHKSAVQSLVEQKLGRFSRAFG
jgi:hypothetical protein